jgi:SAM-dependent methyltransferase
MSYQISKFKKRIRNEDPNDARLKILNDAYLTFTYAEILEAMKRAIDEFGVVSNKKILEIGSAGGITASLDANIITSDIRPSHGVSLVIDGNERLPFEANGLKAIVAKDVLHHLARPEDFFKEVERVLEPGAVVVFAEPNWNLLSRIIFYFIHPEPYLARQKKWNFESSDPMFSNQAIPWIIFHRDKELFTQKFPSLQIKVLDTPLNGISFLASGGVFSRTRISSNFLIRVMKVESKSAHWLKHAGLTRIIVVKKIYTRMSP